MYEEIPWAIIQRMMVDASCFEYEETESSNNSREYKSKIKNEKKTIHTDEEIIEYMLNQQNNKSNE